MHKLRIVPTLLYKNNLVKGKILHAGSRKFVSND